MFEASNDARSMSFSKLPDRSGANHFLPPLARVLAPYSYLACYLLEKFPLLCTHYLGAIRKP